MEQIFLPGLNSQVDYVLKKYNLLSKKILIIGTFSEYIAKKFSELSKETVNIIVPDFDSLMASKVIIKESENINVKIMDYERTDFENSKFDFVYAQASISTINRRKIIKEIKRITSPNANLVIGEIYQKDKNIPQFLKDAFDNSALLPIYEEELNKFYEELGFEIINIEKHDKLLTNYYSVCKKELTKSKLELNENEQSHYKKLLKKISHESNIFTKFNGERYIGFAILELRRK